MEPDKQIINIENNQKFQSHRNSNSRERDEKDLGRDKINKINLNSHNSHNSIKQIVDESIKKHDAENEANRIIRGSKVITENNNYYSMDYK